MISLKSRSCIDISTPKATVVRKRFDVNACVMLNVFPLSVRAFWFGAIGVCLGLMKCTWLAQEYKALNMSDTRQEINLAASMFWGISEFLWVIDHSPMFMSTERLISI
jgi:hypothetical protein